MSVLQIIAVALTIGLNALDGFDVLSISFASPGIYDEWGLKPGTLGIVLSMELVGMCFGSIFLGGLADKIGRRPTVLGCLTVMAVGMFMVTTVNGIVGLSIWRVITGLGIGGMLAAINAIVAEFSNAKHKNMNVSWMVIGYPLGAVVGGIIASQLLKSHDWRAVFYFGASITALFIPLAFWFVPESVHWLTQKQPAGALDKINRTLQRMGHSIVAALPTIHEDVRKRSIGDIFAPGLAMITILITATYFFHITTFYFIVKWVPKIVVDMGFPPASAGGVLVWVNVGGAIGGAVVGLLTQRFGLKILTIAMLLLSAVMVSVFGQSPADLDKLSMFAAAAGFCTNAGIAGLYGLFVLAFPTHVRAFGTGFAIGIGRGGAVLAPIIAGFLFATGQGLPTVAVVMSLGSLIAAGLVSILKLSDDGAIAKPPSNKVTNSAIAGGN